MTSHDHPTDIASNQDRVYFKEHPDETSYIRPMVPGEFIAAEQRLNGAPMPAHVIVEQLAPGIRRRRGIHLFRHEQVRPFEEIPATVDGFRLMVADE